MVNYKKSKKFIAILGEEDMGDGTSSFYIVDEEFYKKEGCVSNEEYMPEVYDAIEQLGKGCSLDAENFFTVDFVMKHGEDDLRKFLKPLNWIVVESDYLNGAKIQEFKNTNKDFMQEMKNLNSSNIVFLNELGDDYLKKILCRFNSSVESFLQNDIKKGLNWVKKNIDDGKYLVVDNNGLYYIYTYENKDAYLQAYQKAQEIKHKLIPQKKPPENAPMSVKIASELKIPYLISNSEKEIDDWEKLASRFFSDVIRGDGQIFAFKDLMDYQKFMSRMLKTKKESKSTLLKKNAKKLNIPYYTCNSREDFEKLQSKLSYLKGVTRMLQVGNTIFVFKDEKEMKKLNDFAILDESSDENDEESENN